MLALIEAAGVVGAGGLRQSGSLELGLEGVFEGLLAAGVATTSFMAGLANVALRTDTARGAGFLPKVEQVGKSQANRGESGA